MQKLFTLIIYSTFLCFAACTSKSTPTNDSVKTVEAYLNAYNDQEIEQMLEYLSDDISWMSISNDQLTIQTQGKDSLKDILENYFQELASTRSEIQQVAANGNFVNAFEKASWEDKNGDIQAQCAASVYELKEGLIKSIWYFNSFECSE